MMLEVFCNRQDEKIFTDRGFNSPTYRGNIVRMYLDDNYNCPHEVLKGIYGIYGIPFRVREFNDESVTNHFVSDGTTRAQIESQFPVVPVDREGKTDPKLIAASVIWWNTYDNAMKLLPF